MCGLVGFFVGCDLKLSCPLHNMKKSRGPAVGKAAFKTWETKASVRHGPNRAEAAIDPLMPSKLVPILQHPYARAIDPNAIRYLQQMALLRFLDFTHHLEMLVVNTVTSDIAFGRYDLNLSDNMKLDAHRIYVDEAYHALFSYEMMLATKRQILDRPDSTDSRPLFMERFLKLTNSCSNTDKALLQLCFVIVSEMLITSTLHDVRKHGEMDSAVRDMIDDHARDEARHHAYYQDILEVLIPLLSRKQLAMVIAYIPKFLLTYTAPDIPAIKSEITNAGLTF